MPTPQVAPVKMFKAFPAQTEPKDWFQSEGPWGWRDPKAQAAPPSCPPLWCPGPAQVLSWQLHSCSAQEGPVINKPNVAKSSSSVSAALSQ